MPLTDVVARLAECAQRKQPWAVKLWLAYRWGEPIQRAEVTGENGEPIIHMVEIVKDHGAEETTP
jgi:hypothetical protein